MEFGLCCKFYKENIKFKEYTLTSILKLNKEDRKNKILNTFNYNIQSLQKSIDFCKENKILSFRVTSTFIPHHFNLRNLGDITPLMDSYFIEELQKIDSKGIILSLHPGQFVNIGSPHEDVIKNSIKDLKEHFFIAKPLNIKEINIHLGGAYGDRENTKKRFIKNIKEFLTKEELNLMTLENDELNFSIVDVLEVGNILGVRVTFDIHHQRVFDEINLKKRDQNFIYDPNNSKILELEKNYYNYYLLCKKTWVNQGYQRMHISSPKVGYGQGSKGRPHSDYVEHKDIPFWMLEDSNLFVDIEAKNKEIAILDLQKYILNYSN